MHITKIERHLIGARGGERSYNTRCIQRAATVDEVPNKGMVPLRGIWCNLVLPGVIFKIDKIRYMTF